MHMVKLISSELLKPNPRNTRTHSRRQIRQIANSILTYGFTVPVLADEKLVLLAGHGRFEAAKLLDIRELPTIVLDGLSEAKKRALLIADNKIAENAGWDRKGLALELPERSELLIEEGLEISITGFAPVEIDQLATDFEEKPKDPADNVSDGRLSLPQVSRRGDLWWLGPHRLLCGDAREESDMDRLLGHERAGMAFLDPPFNVKVRNIVGRGRIKHDEFAMASGEMSSTDFLSFLAKTLGERRNTPAMVPSIMSVWTGAI